MPMIAAITGSASCAILMIRANMAAFPISEMSDSRISKGLPISEALFGSIIYGKSDSGVLKPRQSSTIGVISLTSAFPSEKRFSSDFTFFLKATPGIRSMVSR